MQMDDDQLELTLTLDVESVRLLYNSVCFHLDKWSGGAPTEQESLISMKSFLYAAILEHNFHDNK